VRLLHALDARLDPGAPRPGRVRAWATAETHLGFDPVLLSFQEDQEASTGGPVPHHRRSGHGWTRWVTELQHVLRQEASDLLCAHGSLNFGLAARWASWRLGRPVVFEPWTPLDTHFAHLPRRLRCPWGALVAPDVATAQRWRSSLPTGTPRVFVLPDPPTPEGWRRTAEGLFEIYDVAARTDGRGLAPRSAWSAR
jgi:hypothetical protein